MRQQPILAAWMAWAWTWRRRTSAWGALLDEQQILLAALALQPSGRVRVAVFEHQHTPAGLLSAGERDSWLVQQLRTASAHLPRRERALALALHGRRCRQGVYAAAADLNAQQLAAEVQLEAASALGVAPQDVGFDFAPVPNLGATEQPIQSVQPVQSVHWAACTRQDLQHWQGHARRAGWRLPMVEPEQQAVRRAVRCLHGDARAHWAQSPQDWQFERLPVRHLDETEWQALQASSQWGPLAACGAALGLMA